MPLPFRLGFERSAANDEECSVTYRWVCNRGKGTREEREGKEREGGWRKLDSNSWCDPGGTPRKVDLDRKKEKKEKWGNILFSTYSLSPPSFPLSFCFWRRHTLNGNNGRIVRPDKSNFVLSDHASRVAETWRQKATMQTHYSLQCQNTHLSIHSLFSSRFHLNLKGRRLLRFGNRLFGWKLICNNEVDGWLL